MQLQKTLLAVACSLALVACGGGDGSSDQSITQPVTPVPTDPNKPTNPVPEEPKKPEVQTDLEKAKQLITVTKGIISYYDSFAEISEQYKKPLDVINQTANDVVNATELVTLLAELALNDAQGKTKEYRVADLQKLLDQNAKSNDAADSYILKNSSLTVTASANSVQLAGEAQVQYWLDYNYDKASQDGYTQGWWLNPKYSSYGQQANISVNNLIIEAPFYQTTAQHNFKIKQGGSIKTVNLNNQQATLNFKSDSTLILNYDQAVNLDHDLEPKRVALKIANVALVSEGVTAQLTEVSTQAQAVKIKDGRNNFEQVIPSQIKLQGELVYQEEQLGLDATIKLNNDLTKTIDITNGESSNNFINASLNIALSGQLKGGKNTTQPFSLVLEAKRNEYAQGSGLFKVVVGQHALDINLKAQQANKEQGLVVSGTVSEKAGASVHIEDIANFKSSSIMVNGKSYGAITKNSSNQYVASFTDKTLQYITP